MFKRFETLRARLLVTLLMASLSPLVVALLIAVPWFGRSVSNQAQRMLNTNQAVARGLFDEHIEQRNTQVGSLASLMGTVDLKDSDATGAELSRQAQQLGFDFIVYVDKGNVVRASTSSKVGFSPKWGKLRAILNSKETTAMAGIVPAEDFAAMGAGSRYELELKETEGGTATVEEAAGALSVVAVAPVVDAKGRPVGSVVGIDVLKLDNDLVDSISEKVGGVATIFQNGVRVATTVRTAAGERAVGTAISDKIRQATLVEGQSYRGEAFVVNKDYLTAYDVIRDGDGQIIGMVFVGLDQAPYQREQRNFGLGMAAMILIATVLSILMAWIASAQLSAPITAVSDAAERVAAGDLTVLVPESGFREAKVMGHGFNTMMTSLSELIGRVGTSASKLDRVSGEIATAANLEADGATAQASAVAEATATISELDRSFTAVADGAGRVVEIAEDSLEFADKGRTAVEAGTDSVQRLAVGAEAVHEAAAELSRVAEDIGQVTFVIGSIAEQTKILALNAAIEAARAGDVGKGFGVVATEVRGLADSVSKSVGQIETLVRTIQESSRQLALDAERQVTLGQETGADVVRTRDSFDQIYERMGRTAMAAREIAGAAVEQQAAARQIVEVMHQVSEGVSGTAASARQLAAAAGDVSSEAETLAGGLQGFRTR